MTAWHYSTWFRTVFAVITVGMIAWGVLLFDALIEFDEAAQYRAAHAASLAGLSDAGAERESLLKEGWRRVDANPEPVRDAGAAANQIAADGALVTYFSGVSNWLIAAVIVVWTGAVGALLLTVRPTRRS